MVRWAEGWVVSIVLIGYVLLEGDLVLVPIVAFKNQVSLFYIKTYMSVSFKL